MTTARSERVEFIGADGVSRLAARLDSPAGTPKAYALFAHCFTCTHNVFAASRIAERLTAHGIAVLRFDFTGLGASEGEFANTDFSSNVGDLVAAAGWLRQARQAPGLIIGHSLGGAAVLAAAGQVPEVRAVATIAAPAEPAHVARLFQPAVPEIEARGEAQVRLAGRPFRIRKQFLDDIAGWKLADDVARLRRALLVCHAPLDQTVGIENASRIFAAAKHPKSFIALDGADHLLSRREDAIYAADMIAAWAERYLDAAAITESPAAAEEGTVVVTGAGAGTLAQTISVGGRHVLRADEPVAYGGSDSGPSPYDLLLAALGACTAMTLRLYAGHKGFPLEEVSVTLKHAKIHAENCASCESPSAMIDHIERAIVLSGPLDQSTRQRLLEIAEKCPVHRTLTSKVSITTQLVP